jgi:hypothetical protein
MKLLLDHNVPAGFRSLLSGHTVRTAREMGWQALSNGKLLRAASEAPFDAIICIDKKMEYEHNLLRLPLPVIVLDAPKNALPFVAPFAPFVLALLAQPLTTHLHSIAADGQVTIVLKPR